LADPVGRIGCMSTGKERGMPALDLSGACWHKSSRSSDVMNCVEVAFAGPVVAVRDSKNLTDSVLTIPPAAWAAFINTLRNDALGH
jgi:hypothetical protein